MVRLAGQFSCLTVALAVVFWLDCYAGVLAQESQTTSFPQTFELPCLDQERIDAKRASFEHDFENAGLRQACAAGVVGGALLAYIAHWVMQSGGDVAAGPSIEKKGDNQPREACDHRVDDDALRHDELEERRERRTILGSARHGFYDGINAAFAGLVTVVMNDITGKPLQKLSTWVRRFFIPYDAAWYVGLKQRRDELCKRLDASLQRYFIRPDAAGANRSSACRDELALDKATVINHTTLVFFVEQVIAFVGAVANDVSFSSEVGELLNELTIKMADFHFFLSEFMHQGADGVSDDTTKKMLELSWSSVSGLLTSLMDQVGDVVYGGDYENT